MSDLRIASPTDRWKRPGERGAGGASSRARSMVLLFYQDCDRDSWFRNDRYLKRAFRPVHRLFTRKQTVSGFYVWWSLLVRALRSQGYDVRCNDYRLARQYPEHPVGLVGYPWILNNWSLDNPALLGPGFYDHPRMNPRVMEDPRYRGYLVTCDWMKRMFEPFYAGRCLEWRAGMDLHQWTDTRHLKKDVDLLIYDKIRWNRDHYVPKLLEPIQEHLDRHGRSYRVIRYGLYDHAFYRRALREARAMIFLCEHETQGMAYQEALASNLPLLAWENGFWLDPRRPQFDPEPVPATSVPYFSPECGEKFRGAVDFGSTFDRFWANRDTYTPRSYVERELSFAKSAELYITHYQRVARGEV